MAAGEVGRYNNYMDDKLYDAARSNEGADVPFSDEQFLRLTPGDQNNALHVAAKHGNHEFITRTLSRIININPAELLCKHNSKGETPLHLAAQSGSMKTVQALLHAHDEISTSVACWRERDNQGDTPLHSSLRHGRDEIALLMLERILDLELVEKNGSESLAYLAAQKFCPNFLQRILDADRQGLCSESFSGSFGQTVFHPARKLTGDIMSMAIERRKHLLKVQDDKGKTVLDYAVEEERDSLVEILLKADNTLAYLHDNDGLTPLHIAASKGFFRIIQMILELSPQSITIRDKRHGQTALHVVKMDGATLARCLRNTRMRELINEVDNDGNTPLHSALKCSDFATAHKLLEVDGISWWLTNKQGYSPIDLCTADDKTPLKLKRLAAAAGGGWRVKEEVINMGIFFHKDVVNADDALDHNTWDECLTYRGPHGDSILHLAARDGNMKLINRVHECNSARLVLLSGKNSKGETPLHLAAESGHLDVVKHILSLASPENDENPSTVIDMAIENGSTGSKIDAKPWRIKSANGDTPAHKAVRNKHNEVAIHLLQRDPELISFNNNAKESLLYLAADNACYDVLKHILSKDREYDDSITSGREGRNVIHAAARGSIICLRYCKTLLKKQPYLLKKVDDNGKTPLHHAIEEGLIVTAKLLLEDDKSAAFVYDNEGFTPILRAAVLGVDECINILLDLCPQSAELRDLSSNRTVLHLSDFRGFDLRLCMKHNDMVKLVNETDEDGNTPLHLAILRGNIDMAQVLLETQGIDLTIANKQHQLPLDLCRMLLQKGTNSATQGSINYLLVSLTLKDGLRRSSSIKAKLSILFKFVFRVYVELLVIHENLKKLLDNIALASTILLTITFAATFTIPGGYNSKGEAIGLKRAALKVFLASDVLAMLMSISILARYAVGVGRGDKLRKLAIDSIIMLQISLAATVVAFISSVYAMSSQAQAVIFVPIAVTGLLNLILSIIPEFLWA